MTEVRRGRRPRRSGAGSAAVLDAAVLDAAVLDAAVLGAAERNIAGYSLVRTLGRGDDARVLLGVHAGQPDDDGGAPHDPVAVKIFDHPGTDQAVIAELSALDAVRSPHVVRLIDVAALPGEPVCAILERCAGGSLAALLRRADGLATGEAVTILTGVGRGLAALHDVGRQHGRLAATRVLFDESGRPVLIGLGGVRWSDTDIDDRAAGDRSDAERFGLLCAQVLSSVRDPDAAPEPDVRRIAALALDESAELEDALFALAPPSPITRLLAELSTSEASTQRKTRSGMAPRGTVQTGGPDTVRTGRPAPDEEGPAGVPGPRGFAASLAALAVEHLDESPIALARQRAGAFMHAHRRPAVAGVVAAIALATGTVLLMPSRATPTGNPPTLWPPHSASAPLPEAPTSGPRPSDVPETAVSSSAASSSAASPSASPPVAATSQPRGSSTSPSPSVGRRAAAGDDPVPAAAELINRRHRCFALRSDQCLASVDQVGSDLLVSDVAALRGAPDRGATDSGATDSGATDSGATDRGVDLIDAAVAHSAVELINRTGGAAIVSISAETRQVSDRALATQDPGATAAHHNARPLGSALLVLGPEGWRLRDVWPQR